jgi:hypothetical protein
MPVYGLCNPGLAPQQRFGRQAGTRGNAYSGNGERAAIHGRWLNLTSLACVFSPSPSSKPAVYPCSVCWFEERLLCLVRNTDHSVHAAELIKQDCWIWIWVGTNSDNFRFVTHPDISIDLNAAMKQMSNFHCIYENYNLSTAPRGYNPRPNGKVRAGFWGLK